jgi:hypothetical protein
MTHDAVAFDGCTGTAVAAAEAALVEDRFVISASRRGEQRSVRLDHRLVSRP